ncbi:hypothetical protein MSAN_00134200 [Mycena sanguinolenta]|uniref:Uncharacterized protein n=1 Tax=Mycena sanguinolenta TaxID=230812 RepID=A0A8H6ZIW3_9AGAR|nr:hypothetical protein MSAN_00134200 [Mycena sanguinolenta]
MKTRALPHLSLVHLDHEFCFPQDFRSLLDLLRFSLVSLSLSLDLSLAIAMVLLSLREPPTPSNASTLKLVVIQEQLSRIPNLITRPHGVMNLPTGVERFSTKEASQLGFPPLQLTGTAIVDFWDANVYNELRQFHQAKGFDPDSQDLVRHLAGHFISCQTGLIRILPVIRISTWYMHRMMSLSIRRPQMFDVDSEVPDPEEDNHDNVRKDCSTSECVEIILNCQQADAVHDGTAALSARFKFLIYLQLVLFLFLGFSLLHDYIGREDCSLVFCAQCSQC